MKKAKYLKGKPKVKEYEIWVVDLTLPLEEMPDYVQEWVKHLNEHPRSWGIDIYISPDHFTLNQLTVFNGGAVFAKDFDYMFLDEWGNPQVVSGWDFDEEFEVISHGL